MPTLRHAASRLALALSVALTTGCGAAYHASRGAVFDADGAKEITDDDVRSAFAAAPQLPATSRVAYYTFDDDKVEAIEKMLASVERVSSVYRIPPLLVTGRHHLTEHASWEPPREVGVKKLRLLAARAHADVLVVFDHGWRGGGANGLVALNVLVVPIFVLPWLSSETESYAQAFVIDVRNGYLYGEALVTAKGGPDMVTLYGRRPEAVANDQFPALLAQVRTKVSRDLAPRTAGSDLGEARRAAR
jgi:hypothetical protein